MSESQTTTEEAGGADAPDPGIERRARDMGWRPREEYTGSRPFVEATDFVDRADKMLPLMAARTRGQEREITALRARLSEQGVALSEVLEQSRRAERVGYNRAMRELQGRRQQAITDGDVTAVNAVDAEIRDLGPEPKPPEAPNNGAAPPDPAGSEEQKSIVAAWIRRNPWFQTDRVANAASAAMLTVVQQESPDLSLEEALVEVEDRIRQRFDLPGSTRRRATAQQGEETTTTAEAVPPRRRASVQQHSAVSASNSAPSRRVQPRTFDAMPAEVRAQFERQKRALGDKGKPFTKDEFAEYYYEQFPEEAA